MTSKDRIKGGIAELEAWLKQNKRAKDFLLTDIADNPPLEVERPLPTKLKGLRCHRVVFSKGSVAGTNLRDAVFDHCAFHDGALARKANLTNAELNGCMFRGTQSAKLGRATIDSGSFENIDLSDVTLNSATIRGVTFDGTVKLPGPNGLAGLKLDRAAWERLEGELTSDQRAEIDIEDDGEILRHAYTGAWFRLHVIALLVFLLPHVAFFAKTDALSHPCTAVPAHRDAKTDDDRAAAVAQPASANDADAGCKAMFHRWRDDLRRWSSQLRKTEPCETMLGLYWDHLVDREATWCVRYIKLGTGVLLLLYNLLRAVLMVKAASLVRRPRFSFRKEPRWGCLFRSYKLLFLFNVAVVLVHLATFLLHPIHVSRLGG